MQNIKRATAQKNTGPWFSAQGPVQLYWSHTRQLVLLVPHHETGPCLGQEWGRTFALHRCEAALKEVGVRGLWHLFTAPPMALQGRAWLIFKGFWSPPVRTIILTYCDAQRTEVVRYKQSRDDYRNPPKPNLAEGFTLIVGEIRKERGLRTNSLLSGSGLMVCKKLGRYPKSLFWCKNINLVAESTFLQTLASGSLLILQESSSSACGAFLERKTENWT